MSFQPTLTFHGLNITLVCPNLTALNLTVDGANLTSFGGSNPASQDTSQTGAEPQPPSGSPAADQPGGGTTASVASPTVVPAAVTISVGPNGHTVITPLAPPVPATAARNHVRRTGQSNAEGSAPIRRRGKRGRGGREPVEGTDLQATNPPGPHPSSSSPPTQTAISGKSSELPDGIDAPAATTVEPATGSTAPELTTPALTAPTLITTLALLPHTDPEVSVPQGASTMFGLIAPPRVPTTPSIASPDAAPPDAPSTTVLPPADTEANSEYTSEFWPYAPPPPEAVESGTSLTIGSPGTIQPNIPLTKTHPEVNPVASSSRSPDGPATAEDGSVRVNIPQPSHSLSAAEAAGGEVVLMTTPESLPEAVEPTGASGIPPADGYLEVEDSPTPSSATPSPVKNGAEHNQNLSPASPLSPEAMESPTSPSFTPPAKPPAAAHSEIEAAATISRSSADPASADTAAGGVGSEPDERLPPSGSPLLDAREPVASDAVNVASADLHSTDQAVAEIPAPAKLTKKQKRVEARKRAEERRTAEEASPTETLVATATPLIADAPADGEGAPTRSPGTAAPATAEADTNHDDDLHPSTPLPLDIPDDADSEAEADGGTVEGEIAGTTKMSKTKKRVASRKRAAERWKNGAEERRKHAWDIAPLVAVHAAQAEADGTLCLQFFTEETLLDSAGKEIILRPIYERYLTQLGNLNSIERSPKHIPMTFDGFATEFISKSYTFPGCSVWKAGLTMRQASLCTAHFEMLLAVLEPVGGPAQMTQQIMSRNQEVFLARMNYWNNRQNPHTDSPDPCTEFLSAKFAEEYMNLIKKYRRWDVNAPAPTEATTAT